MKKTNVMIEVSEDIYDRVVYPYKKKKSFGKLVCQLLDAYANNDSIYSYINGVNDSIEDEAVQGLLNDLNSMSQNLSMMGMLESQAEAIVDNGYKEFSKVAEKAEKEFKDFGEEVREERVVTTGLSREDVVDIVNDSMKDIKSMLEQVLSSGFTGTGVNDSKISEPVDRVEYEHSVVNTSVVEESIYVEKEIQRGVEDRDNIIEEPISSEEEEKAQNALSSLMGSLSF